MNQHSISESPFKKVSLFSVVFCRTRLASDVLPTVDLLSEIACCLPKLKHCVRLAERLGLSPDFVKRLREGRLRSTTALDILYKWRQERPKHAKGKALLDALIAINRRDVAACFAYELLGQGK